MYRIILVDDEPQIRKGLSSLIIWEEFGLELVGEAADGNEALNLIKQAAPHIVILDIQMPSFDGLSLLKEAKKLPNAPKFIVLSGFAQFEYVREAMRLGACNYLLKPVNEEELKTSLWETIRIIEQESMHTQQFDESIQNLFNNTMTRLLQGKIEVRELREKCQLLGITLRCNAFYVGILKFSTAVSVSSLSICMDICKEVFQSHLTTYCVTMDSDTVAIIIKNPDHLYSNKAISSLLSDCTQRIKDVLQAPVESALGVEVSSFRDIPTSYQSAFSLLDIKGIDHSADIAVDSIIHFQQIIYTEIELESLQTQLSNGAQEDVAGIIKRFFHKISTSTCAADLITAKYYSIELATYILQAAQKCFIPTPELTQIKADIYRHIRKATDIGMLSASLCEMAESIRRRVQNLEFGNYSRTISQVIRHISKYYADKDLSLKTLANQLNVNSAYLGRQFTLETGLFFSDYLNSIRIKQAQILLSTTNLKIAEVADAVGFSSVSYFNTVYKKIMGEKPSLSRQTKSE